MEAPIGKFTLVALILAVLAAGSTGAWAQSCPASPSYSPDFTSNESCLTLNGSASFPTPAGSATSITSWSGSNGVVTFKASNSFTAGEVILLSSFANSTFFNGLAFPVLKTGLSRSQFEISFSGYTGSSDTGTATPLRTLQLTPARLLQAGSAWFNTQQQVSTGFSTTFTFQLSGSNTFNADGFAFVIQNSSSVNSEGNPTALGPNGCGIGFGDSSSGCTSTTGGIPNSLAVEFNTYLNQGVDKSGNSVSIQSNGTNPNCVDTSCTLPGGLNYQLPVTLTDGNIHVVQVSYSLLSTPTEINCLVGGNPGPCFDVIIDGNDLFPAGVAVNLGTLLNLNNLDNAWVGFTAGTGSGDDNQDILSWTFTTQAQSQSGTVTTSAPTVFNYNGGQSNGGNDYNAQLTSGTSTTAVVTEIPMAQSACNALLQANPLFNTAECFIYQNGGGPGVDASVMYELTCPGSPTGGTCGSSELPDFQATLGSDFDFSFVENPPLTLNSFGLPNLTSQSGLPAVGYLKGSGPDPLHPCTPYTNNNPPLFQSNQVLSFTLGDTSGGAKGRGSGTGSCWLVTYETPGEVPTVSITAPANNSIYQQGSMQLANYTCNAVNEGTSTTGPYLSVASCTANDSPGGSVANGAQFDTTTLGTHTFTASVTDSALNTSSATVTYDVQTTQTITFPAIANQTYGVAPLTLNATASSGLAVTYAVISGPASVSGNLLSISGTGFVTVQASQSGNASYSAATPVSQTFTVSQQAPTVSVTTVSPASETYGSLTPTTVTASLSWTGSGTVPTAGMNFSSTSAGTFGSTSCTSGSSPITCSASFTPNPTDGAGTYTISARYGGDSNYAAAASTQTNNYSITQAVLTVSAASALGTYGQPLPPLMYNITGFLNGDSQASATTGSPSEGTAASPSSTPGVYAITIAQGTLAAANYTFTFVNGALTLQQAASTVAVTSLDSSIYPNQTTALTATVSVVGSGAPPTGTVNFKLGVTSLGTGMLSPIDATDSAATLTLNGSQLSLGSNAITGVYSGDANYGGSTSAAISISLLSPLVNFGSVNVGTAATVQSVTYNFNNATTLSAVKIATKGASGVDYTDGGSSTCTAGTAYAAGQSCVVTVAFTPSAPGVRSGAVELFAQGANQPVMTWYVNGVGLSGGVTIDPGTQATIATLANSGQAYGIAIDGGGNVYVVDHANSVIIQLAAGSFTQGTLVSTGLSSPTAVALDGAGNLYISDTGNSRVAVVPNEQGGLNAADISTVSISGLNSPRGLATDASGNLYVTDSVNGNVIEVAAGGGAAVTVASGLTSPSGVAVDSAGNVYVASANQVSEYPFVSAGMYGTPIPIGSGYNNANGIAVDAAGAVYVADTGNARIVRVAPGGSSQTMLPVTGLTTPQGVAVDSADNVFVTDPSVVIQVNRAQAAPLTFASTNVDSTSAPQTITVSGAGNQALTISNLAVSTNFTQVPSGGTDCSSSTQLANGSQCLIAIAFAPTASGALAGSLSLTDNALNKPSSSQTVQLSGNGLQVSQTIAFTPIGNQTYGVAPFSLSATASSGLTPVTFSASGPASISGNILTITGAGSVTVQANQAGNIEYASTSTSQTITVSPAVLTVTANNQNMAYGGTVPALTVTYNGFVNGDGPSSLSGILSCSTSGNSSAAAGSYPITCAGQSSPNYTINYVPGALTIIKAGTTTSLSSTPNPSAFGQSVTFTASITPASGSGETGTVSWSANTGCGTTSVTSGTPGTATCVASALAVGNNTVTATYSGDGNHSSSIGTTSQTVSVAGSATALVSSANPSLYGNSVSFTATVTAVAPGMGTPTGTVTFMDGTTTLGSVALSGGHAVLTTSALHVGAQSIAASYGGSSSFSGSSATLAQTVNQLPAFTCLNTVTFSEGVAGSFTVTATGFPTPAITESGALPAGITFTGGSGTATLSGTSSAVGTYTITFTASNAAGTATQTFTLIVAGPAAAVSPTSISFMNVKCLSAASNSVTLTNTGNAALTISSVSLSLGANTDQDDFKVNSGCSSSLGAGKSCSIKVTYCPDDPGSQSATLVIRDNAGSSPQQVSITGTNTCQPGKD